MKFNILLLTVLASISSFAVERTCTASSFTMAKMTNGNFGINVCCQEKMKGLPNCIEKTAEDYLEANRIQSLFSVGDKRALTLDIAADGSDFIIVEGGSAKSKSAYLQSILKTDCMVEIIKKTRFERDHGNILTYMVIETDEDSIVDHEQMASFLETLYVNLDSCKQPISNHLIQAFLRVENSDSDDLGYNFFGADIGQSSATRYEVGHRSAKEFAELLLQKH